MMFMFRLPGFFRRMARQPRGLGNWFKPEEMSVEIRNVILLLLQDQLNAERRYRALVQEVTRDLRMIESHCTSIARWLKTAEAERNAVLLGTAAVGLFRKGHVLASNVSSYAALIKDRAPQFGGIVAADIADRREVTSATALTLAQRGVMIGPDTEALASSINVNALSRRQRRKLAARLAQIADDVAVASRFICEEFTSAQTVDPGTVVVVLGQMENLAKGLAEHEQAIIGGRRRRGNRR